MILPNPLTRDPNEIKLAYSFSPFKNGTVLGSSDNTSYRKSGQMSFCGWSLAMTDQSNPVKSDISPTVMPGNR